VIVGREVELLDPLVDICLLRLELLILCEELVRYLADPVRVASGAPCLLPTGLDDTPHVKVRAFMRCTALDGGE
jgi:hypothetical protein